MWGSNQGVGQAEVFLKVFKQKMLDIDSLNLNSGIHDIDQLRPYKRFSKKKKKKNSCGCEQYLFYVKEDV